MIIILFYSRLGPDDNSYILTYSVHIHLKTRSECGTSLNMTPTHCYIKFTQCANPCSHHPWRYAGCSNPWVVSWLSIVMHRRYWRGGPQIVRLLVISDGVGCLLSFNLSPTFTTRLPLLIITVVPLFPLLPPVFEPARGISEIDSGPYHLVCWSPLG